MHRITVTIDSELMGALDHAIARSGYSTRSEAIRDLVRLGLRNSALEAGDVRECVGILSYIYDHEARDLARRLTTSHHHNHDISIASMHIHLDEANCLEVSVLKGATETVCKFAEAIIAQKTVSYGELKVVPKPMPAGGVT